jgi:hypothetical protein
MKYLYIVTIKIKYGYQLAVKLTVLNLKIRTACKNLHLYFSCKLGFKR